MDFHFVGLVPTNRLFFASNFAEQFLLISNQCVLPVSFIWS